MAIRLATTADIAVILAGARPAWGWTAASLAARMRSTVTHIDDATGSWVQTALAEDGSREIIANPFPLAGWGALMRFHALTHPAGTVTFCVVDLPAQYPAASRPLVTRLHTYLAKLYTVTPQRDGSTRYSSTMGAVTTKATTVVP